MEQSDTYLSIATITAFIIITTISTANSYISAVKQRELDRPDKICAHSRTHTKEKESQKMRTAPADESAS